MPNTRSGPHTGKPPRQQVRPCDPSAPDRLVHHHAHLFPLTGVQVPPVRNTVLDHRGGRRARVPEELVEMGYMHHWNGGLVCQRVQRERDVALGGGVVLEVHGGNVHARAAAECPGHRCDLLGPLQDYGIHTVRIELSRFTSCAAAGHSRPPRPQTPTRRRRTI